MPRLLERLHTLSPTFVRVILDDLEHEIESLDPASPDFQLTRISVIFDKQRVRSELRRRQRVPVITFNAWPTDGGTAMGVVA